MRGRRRTTRRGGTICVGVNATPSRMRLHPLSPWRPLRRIPGQLRSGKRRDGRRRTQGARPREKSASSARDKAAAKRAADVLDRQRCAIAADRSYGLARRESRSYALSPWLLVLKQAPRDFVCCRISVSLSYEIDHFFGEASKLRPRSGLASQLAKSKSRESEVC